MINKYFGNYKNFQCIADKCPATCCSGWAIEIDDDALSMYKEMDLDGVDYDNGTFFNDKTNMDCHYLNKSGLCDLYLAHGDGIFCRTCDMYPRHIEEFPGVREYSLSISCPVVAKEFIGLHNSVSSILTETDNEEDDEIYDDFDDSLYNTLLDTREGFFSILNKSTEATLFDDLNKILTIAAKVQAEYDGILEPRYTGGISLNDPKYISSLFDIFLSLEPLNNGFHKMVAYYRNQVMNGCFEKRPLGSSDKSLSADEISEMMPFLKDFLNKNKDMYKVTANITYYFIYTYFCGAAYDEYIYGMAAVAVYSSLMILLIMALKWMDTSKLDESIIYLFSRELEHSTDNMIALEGLLEDNRL